MINKESIIKHKGTVISGDENHLYLSPHISLQPYISHYCITFPNPQLMSDRYTVLPAANSVLCVSEKNGLFNFNLNGTNTKASIVGTHANTNHMMLLVKFRVGGLYSFYGFNQDEFSDKYLDLYSVDTLLTKEIEHTLIDAKTIEEIEKALNRIFYTRLKSDEYGLIRIAKNKIILGKGNISLNELSTEIGYSEKHLRRMFLRHIGTSPKKFARIIRVNYALNLIQNEVMNFTRISEKAGFFDQAHFIHDFKDIFGITPGEYMVRMSDFYNAESI